MSKYIVTKAGKAFVFPETTSHSDVARKVDIRSAGYYDGKRTYGSSHSTGIRSRKSDINLVKKALNPATGR